MFDLKVLIKLSWDVFSRNKVLKKAKAEGLLKFMTKVKKFLLVILNLLPFIFAVSVWIVTAILISMAIIYLLALGAVVIDELHKNGLFVSVLGISPVVFQYFSARKKANNPFIKDKKELYLSLLCLLSKISCVLKGEEAVVEAEHNNLLPKLILYGDNWIIKNYSLLISDVLSQNKIFYEHDYKYISSICCRIKTDLGTRSESLLEEPNFSKLFKLK